MSRSDKIIIESLELECIIGVLPVERTKKQSLTIDIELTLDLSHPAKTDDIEDTLDYFKIYESIVSLVENSEYYLLEKLAEEISDLCLSNSMVNEVEVKIQKPKAFKKAKSAGVQIKRSKKLS